MFPEPSAFAFFSTLATEFALALALGFYLVNDVRRKQKL